MRVLLTVLLLTLTPLSQAEAIRIGLNYPSTGNYRDEGQELLRGAQMAVAHINNNGGVMGRPLELLRENTASRVEQAEKNVDRMAAQGARMLFGGASSEETIAASRRARQHNLLYFPTLSYANDVTGLHGHRYQFSDSNNAWMSARVLGEYLSWNMPRQRYHYIILDDAWGRSMESALRLATGTTDRARYGRSALPTGLVRRDQYRAALEKAAASEADILVLVLLGENLQRTLRMVQNMGLKKQMQIIVPNLTKSVVQQAGPGIMEDIIGTEAWVWNLDGQQENHEFQQFVSQYIRDYQEYPGSTTASAYAIVRQWADAASRAKSLEPEAIIKALEGHRYRLLKDEQEWRAFDHLNVQSIYLVRVRKRNAVMQDPLKQHYFEVIHQMAGETAAPSLEEWQGERGEALVLN